MYRLGPLFFFIFFASILFAKEPYFHKVPAKEGDFIFSFLERYHLEGYSCNFDRFYKLNNLTNTSKLVAGKKYYIPVLIYDYNGKSIRSTIGIDGWEQAVRIKKYNEQVRKEKLRRQTLVNSMILWVPYHELHCLNNPIKAEDVEIVSTNTEAVETSIDEKAEAEKRKKEYTKVDDSVLNHNNKITGYRKFPIFGSKYAYVPLLDKSLQGKVYYIVSGHGGPDSGAVGKVKNNDLCEDEYAYDVALRLCRNLLERGALVYMITRDPNDGMRDGKYLKCDIDEYCWGNLKIPRQQKRRLYQRSDAINELYERHRKQGLTDQTVIAIHIDSRSVKERTDVFFYYFPGSYDAKRLAKKLQRTLAGKYKKYRANGSYHGTVTARDLHMLREPKPKSVYIELGNIKNVSDQQRFILASNRDALAKWLYEGLVN